MQLDQIATSVRRSAFIITIAFFAFVGLLAFMATQVEDTKWQRLLTLFHSLESIGFAAAGLLFGTAVQAPTRKALTAMEKVTQSMEKEVDRIQITAERAKQELDRVADELNGLAVDDNQMPIKETATEMLQRVQQRMNAL